MATVRHASHVTWVFFDLLLHCYHCFNKFTVLTAQARTTFFARHVCDDCCTFSFNWLYSNVTDLMESTVGCFLGRSNLGSTFESRGEVTRRMPDVFPRFGFIMILLHLLELKCVLDTSFARHPKSPRLNCQERFAFRVQSERSRGLPSRLHTFRCMYHFAPCNTT